MTASSFVECARCALLSFKAGDLTGSGGLWLLPYSSGVTGAARAEAAGQMEASRRVALTGTTGCWTCFCLQLGGKL